MEWKIGEIKQVNGEWYQCVESSDCPKCDLKNIECCRLKFPCETLNRKDGNEVVFKKLEKVGEPISFTKGLYFQRYLLYNSAPYYIGEKRLFFSSPIEEFVYIEIEQNKEDMEEQHLTENYTTKEEKIAERIANKVGENISQQLKENLNKEDMKEKKIQLSQEEYDYIKNQLGIVILPGNIADDVDSDKLANEIMNLFSIDTKHSNSEKIGENLKEFDLEAAKSGKPVCTRDGRKARIICFDYKSSDDYSMIALIDINDNEIPYKYTKEGKFNPNCTDAYDLMMLSEKKEGWVNVYKERIYKTKEEAVKANCDGVVTYVDTIKIEYEE